MARHPEVSEKSIIQAGQELEAIGKVPNPGAIRAHLGYRGGLLRIKSIWDKFCNGNKQSLVSIERQELSFDALPQGYADNASELMRRLQDAAEQLAIEAYTESQRIFEKRVKAIEQTHADKLNQYQENEISADDCLRKQEEELSELNTELKALAEQNAALLVENAELRGKISVLGEHVSS